jgi:hypothetical protein
MRRISVSKTYSSLLVHPLGESCQTQAFTDPVSKEVDMKCQRCENLMTEEKIMLSDDEFTAKAVSVSHCLACGRMEYGAVVHNYAIQKEDGPPRFLHF